MEGRSLSRESTTTRWQRLPLTVTGVDANADADAECDLDTTSDKQAKSTGAIKKRVVEKATHVDSRIKEP